MGFQNDVDAIVEYLPKDRQTLLFSATQTKKVSDLARLSLKDPEYVSVHEQEASATPKGLQQNYTVIPLSQKLDTLWSFIQASKKSKIIVFLSSGKQVRFIYESFRHLQPGIPLLHLHGRQKQMARLDITSRFSAAKTACLFSTDVSARGLDFPAVDWVVQVDCPEDADTYIHRVGRTARYEREGRAILFLEPSEEEGMLKRLEQKKVPIERINVRAKKQQSIRNQLQNMCFKDPQLKYLGQKAFSSYVRSIHLQKDKGIFKMHELPLEEFAASLGLPGAPRIRFMKGDDAKARKNAPRQAASSSSDEDSDAEHNGSRPKEKQKEKVRTKYDRMFERQNQDIFSSHYSKLINDEGLEEGGGGGVGEAAAMADGLTDDKDDFLTVKRRIPADADPPSPSAVESLDPATGNKLVQLPGVKNPLVIDSKRREKLLKSKAKLLKTKGDKGKKLVFDEEGKPHEIYELEDEKAFRARGTAEEQRREFEKREKERAKEQDEVDRVVAKEKRREKVRKRKVREKESLEGAGDEEEEEGEGPQIVGGDGEVDALANFLADAESIDEDASEAPELVEVELPKRKRQKKWFEDDSAEEGDRGKGKGKKWRQENNAPVETLEDMERLAQGLLGSG